MANDVLEIQGQTQTLSVENATNILEMSQTPTNVIELITAGPQGIPGEDGIDGIDGDDGDDGASAYQVAVNNGFVGNQAAWLASLEGSDGTDGVGVPEGGTTGQKLVKNSNADYDTKWVDDTGGGVSGIIEIDFGSGANEVEVNVTGQSLLTAEHVPTAEFAFAPSDDHSVNDHRYAAAFSSVLCADIVEEDQFTIYVTSTQRLTGRFNIQWKY